MHNRVYLDANIVLDFLSPDRHKHPQARQLINALMLRGSEIVISEDILTTVYYIAKDKTKAAAFFEMIQHRWEIVHFGSNVIAQALKHVTKTTEDLEDTLQCLCAKKEACTLIITEDKAFAECGVAVIDYKGFLS